VDGPGEFAQSAGLEIDGGVGELDAANTMFHGPAELLFHTVGGHVAQPPVCPHARAETALKRASPAGFQQHRRGRRAQDSELIRRGQGGQIHRFPIGVFVQYAVRGSPGQTLYGVKGLVVSSCSQQGNERVFPFASRHGGNEWTF